MILVLSISKYKHIITLFYVERWGVVAWSPEPGAHVKNARLKKNKNISNTLNIYINTNLSLNTID